MYCQGWAKGSNAKTGLPVLKKTRTLTCLLSTQLRTGLNIPMGHSHFMNVHYSNLLVVAFAYSIFWDHRLSGIICPTIGFASWIRLSTSAKYLTRSLQFLQLGLTDPAVVRFRSQKSAFRNCLRNGLQIFRVWIIHVGICEDWIANFSRSSKCRKLSSKVKDGRLVVNHRIVVSKRYRSELLF